MLEYSAFEHLAQDILSGNLSNIAGKPKDNHYPKTEQIAFVPVHGILTKRASLFDELLGMTSYDALQETLFALSQNPAVETIILDIEENKIIQSVIIDGVKSNRIKEQIKKNLFHL